MVYTRAILLVMVVMMNILLIALHTSLAIYLSRIYRLSDHTHYVGNTVGCRVHFGFPWDVSPPGICKPTEG